MLRLRTFGGLSIENGASIGGATPNRRPLALLALLAVNGSRGLSRDTIAALLWPESEPERARNSLSQLISILRRELGAAHLLLGTAELRVNTEVLACDVIEFERCIAADDLDSATRLYTGPFLEGVFLKNVPEFERWVDQERSRLEHVQGDALERLATCATAAKDHVSAVRFWRRRASLTPSDSRAARELMAALVASGDSAGALAHYRAHRALLHDDLGLEPDASLVEYAAAVRQGTSLPAVVGAAPEATTAPATRATRAEPRPHGPTAHSVSVMRRRRVLLPLAAGVVVAVGLTATWVANRGQSNVGPPPPPSHDSLRLRVVTASVQSADPADSTLAREVRDAALAELARNPWLFVITPVAWLQRAPYVGLDAAIMGRPDTIRKYARKAQANAILDFTLSRAGNGYVLTAEARSASTDSSLGVITVPAARGANLPAAMKSLSDTLRDRLVAARFSLPAQQLSLNTTDEPRKAVELYAEAYAEALKRNWIGAAQRADAAVRIDSTFALAWRLRHSSLYNASLRVADQLDAISAAYRFRDRLRAPYWRLGIEAAYFRAIGAPERSLVFYDSLDRLGSGPIPSFDKGLAYGPLRKFDLAIDGYRRTMDTTYRYITATHSNLVRSLLEGGNVAEAKQVVARLERADSLSRTTRQSRNLLFTAIRGWDSLSVVGKAWLASADTPTDSLVGIQLLSNAAIARGQLSAFDSLGQRNSEILKAYGSPGDFLGAELQRGQLHATLAGDTARAKAIADSANMIAPWASLRPMDRPYLAMLQFLASVGDVKRGLEVAREWSRTTPIEFRRRDSLNVLVGRGEIALSAGDAREAVRLFRLADVRDCRLCFYPRYARAFDALSERDSARVYFERYAAASNGANALGDAVELAHTYFRLGEMSEDRGDARAALGWYERFSTLWAQSDAPALRDRVGDVRRRIERLRKRPA
jgi:DNA-binding SARP family transcriptional activator/tetratricopeptide (TPR) repeat protein